MEQRDDADYDSGDAELDAARKTYMGSAVRWEMPGDEAFDAGWKAARAGEAAEATRAKAERDAALVTIQRVREEAWIWESAPNGAVAPCSGAGKHFLSVLDGPR